MAGKHGCCPYCGEFYGQLDLIQQCAVTCWETRVKPLGWDLATAVLQDRMTLAEAEAAARA